MPRRPLLILALGLVLVVAAPASGDVYSRKAAVDARLSSLQGKIAAVRAREQSLRSELASTAAQIRVLEARVGDVSAKLAPLEQDLALHQRRLDALNELYRAQTQRYHFLRRQYDLALERLSERVVEIYQSKQLGALDVLLGASSFAEALDNLDYLKQIGRQDAGITETVRDAKDAITKARAATRRTRTRVAATTRVIAIRTAQVRAVRDQLVAQQGALAASRTRKAAAASSLEEQEHELLEDADSLAAVSASLGAQIRAAQAAAAAPAPSSSAALSSSGASSSGSSSSSTSTSSVSASGFIWPVSGPVVSPFGFRCLGGICRPHEGIDIGASSGTPIHAAASGTVIVAGVQSGYGNLIVIDHGRGLSTAYAHQSSFAVGYGAHVSQGQVIGYVGCTGRCFGPHLHFEVRVNGSAVDPLGYL